MSSTGPRRRYYTHDNLDIFPESILNALKKKLSQKDFSLPKGKKSVQYHISLADKNWEVIICTVPNEASISRFVLASCVLGQGGQGWVRLAKNIDTQEQVAVKVQEDNTLSFLDDLKRERRNLAIHKRLIATADITHKGTHVAYTFMDYYPGIDLRCFLYEVDTTKSESDPARYPSKKIIDARQKLHLFQLMLEELIKLHEHSLAHRDLKPANFVLDTSGFSLLWRDIKLVDLGSAVINDIEKTRVLCGSFGYIPPECYEDNAPYYDFYCDLYAFGIILCEIFSSCNYQQAILIKLACIEREKGFIHHGMTEEYLISCFPDILGTETELLLTSPKVLENDKEIFSIIIPFIRKLCSPFAQREERGNLYTLKEFLRFLKVMNFKTYLTRSESSSVLFRGQTRRPRSMQFPNLDQITTTSINDPFVEPISSSDYSPASSSEPSSSSSTSSLPSPEALLSSRSQQSTIDKLGDRIKRKLSLRR